MGVVKIVVEQSTFTANKRSDGIGPSLRGCAYIAYDLKPYQIAMRFENLPRVPKT